MGYRRGHEFGGVGGVLGLVLLPVEGCWWWLYGLPVVGEARTGWPRVTLCVVRGLVLLLGCRVMWREVGEPGWGTGVVLACAAAGLAAKSHDWAARHRR